METGIEVPHKPGPGRRDAGGGSGQETSRRAAAGKESLTVEVLIAFNEDALPAGLLDDESRARLEKLASRFADEELRARRLRAMIFWWSGWSG